MILTSTRIWFFTRTKEEVRNERLELVSRVALQHGHYVLLVTYRDRFDYWKSLLPDTPKLSLTDVTSHYIRRERLPEKVAVLADGFLHRGHLASLRTKSMQERIPIITMT